MAMVRDESGKWSWDAPSVLPVELYSLGKSQSIVITSFGCSPQQGQKTLLYLQYDYDFLAMICNIMCIIIRLSFIIDAGSFQRW